MAKGKTKKVEVEVPELFSDGLVALLHAWPHVKTVWLNEKGEHRFHEYPGYTAFDVSEIFIANAAAPKKEDDEKEPGADDENKIKADENAENEK